MFTGVEAAVRFSPPRGRPGWNGQTPGVLLSTTAILHRLDTPIQPLCLTHPTPPLSLTERFVLLLEPAVPALGVSEIGRVSDAISEEFGFASGLGVGFWFRVGSGFE